MADGVRERLERRNEERLAAIERRKAVKENNAQPKENEEYFTSTLAKEKGEIEKLLNGSASVVQGNKMKAIEFFDSLADRCQKLQKFLADSTMFLPSRTIKVSQDALKALQQEISYKREEYVPKKKFAFKSRKKQADTSKAEQASEESALQQETKTDGKKFLESALGFQELADQTLTMSSVEVSNQDITLRDLQNCKVIVYGAPSALHINKLKNCVLLCGPVSGAVFIEDCTACNFILPCHQLRVHSTVDCKFYLHVTSRAIVEDCSNVGFAPFNWEYESLQDDFRKAGLNPAENNWHLVNDFNWLKTDQPSPNWYLISEEQRIQNWAL